MFKALDVESERVCELKAEEGLGKLDGECGDIKP